MWHLTHFLSPNDGPNMLWTYTQTTEEAFPVILAQERFRQILKWKIVFWTSKCCYSNGRCQANLKDLKSYSVFKNTEDFHLLRNHCVTVTRSHELLGHTRFITDHSTILRNYISYVDLKINAGTVFSEWHHEFLKHFWAF